jgi:hypothetical protein
VPTSDHRSPATDSEHRAADFSGRLRSWGVTVLYGPDVYPLHDPDTEDEWIGAPVWRAVLDALEG